MEMIIGFLGLVLSWIVGVVVAGWDWLTDLPAIVWVAAIGIYWLSGQLEGIYKQLVFNEQVLIEIKTSLEEHGAVCGRLEVINDTLGDHGGIRDRLESIKDELRNIYSQVVR